MLISQKQQEANRRNAQKSTGPTTVEGKAAACLNATTYGLRTRRLLIGNEDASEYLELWESLQNEWRPETPTESHYLEQMSVSQWLLARMAASENRIYAAKLPFPEELNLLDRVARHRDRLERSFTAAMHELKQLQKDRRALQAAAAKQTKPSAKSHAPVNGYPAPDDAGQDHLAYRATEATDSR